MATLPQVSRATPTAVPRSRTRSVRPSDLVAILVANLVLIGAMWVRHGGLAELGTAAGLLTAMGQLAALYGTFLALLQLVLMSRSPWLWDGFGPDLINRVHRWLGFAVAWLILGHVVFTTAGWAMTSGEGIIAQLVGMLLDLPFLPLAAVAFVAMIAVTVTSVRAARRRLSYESWHVVHLLAYLAIVLGFAHQVVVGADFADDPVARVYWIGLYVAVAVLVPVFRFGQPLALAFRHRFRVASVAEEAPGVISVYLTGHDLDRFPVQAGQFLNVRFLSAGDWWRGHPFSISARPNGQWLRITIKDLGDDTHRYMAMAPGTPVFIEGPHGVMTPDRAEDRSVLLVAGGIGVTPLRALLEELAIDGRPVTLLYFGRRDEAFVFARELDVIATWPNVTVRYFVGPHDREAMQDAQLVGQRLLGVVPDARSRTAYLCGPAGLMRSIREALRDIGVPAARIHSESFQT